ncbi:uncharacterized protein MELLADRAFT_89914 [Melampsora larici-populina 98AG31]|uniref:Uncharacterized protein n=1 Tax=Melampsora larici-populina (strain 98AG31 / pathotype 3-4-7) TaxID=747676 RepID=F4RV33_MELLP|nr:uncharacterized protein MELLADRAFT_89914 [Melampsora larici-populina 98AG31]EGG03808.1 hypothetical protein MELLADRAFT_89914 [Melampsora larici-populina 98AG31]
MQRFSTRKSYYLTVINAPLRNVWDGRIQLILDQEANDDPIHSSISTFDGKNTVQVTETTNGFSPPSLSSSKNPNDLTKKSNPSLVKRMPIDLMADKGKRSSIPQKLLRIPKILAGLDYDSLPVVKMKSQLEEHFKPSAWLKVVQRILRQITSKAIANGVVGSNWDCFTFQSTNSNSTDLDPSHLSSDLKSAFWGIMVNDEGDESTGIFRRIIMWAPIGTVVKRAEVDLHSNFPEILIAYVNTDSSAGITKHTVNSFDTKRKLRSPVDQYLSYEFTIHRSTDRAEREELKSDLVSESPEDDQKHVFSMAFEFWISVILHHHLSTATQIISIEPTIFKEFKSNRFTASSINLSNGLEGDIKSIYLYSLPIHDPLISTRWKEEERS